MLLNFRKHLRAPSGIDPRSSAAWFDGWAHGATPRTQTCPVAPARTWLGTIGWRRAGGPINRGDCPTEPSQIWRVSHCGPLWALHDMPKILAVILHSSSRLSP